MSLLSTNNLTLGYGDRLLLRNLNFTVEVGNYLCIVGENGSGKSTLVRCLLGLQAPAAGTIVPGDNLKLNQIGYLPQQTVVQKDFPATVWEIVLSGCQGHRGLWPFYSKADKALAKANIARMNLTELTRRCYRELSGGQQQRVLLARALCATKRLLLLDEPVSGLDPRMTAEMYHLIEKLNREENITIIMVTHDLAAAKLYASHILHIGRTTFFGTNQEYFASDLGKHFTALTQGGEGLNNNINS
ncbi:MAG: ABC transporter ATP-binding protein [Victivallales bacterium]|nr:ABC transporter ATP-binding protein [Victivallales bacterium]